jgi:predicted metal-binding protein
MQMMLEQLLQGACLAGATQAAILAAQDIVIEDDLAAKCLQPRCENYGLSMSCPPHVAGPAVLRKELVAYTKALFFKIDVPWEVLFSSDNRELFQLLHEVAAGIEQSAIKLGMVRAKAFAGSSCKSVFCAEHPACQALTAIGRCRHPQSARPSMSGFGINVAELLRRVGWEASADNGGKDVEGTISYVCGLVLLF